MSSNFNVKEIDISDYLCCKDNILKKGKCIVCGKLVPWNRTKLISHKRATCPTADKVFWKGKFFV